MKKRRESLKIKLARLQPYQIRNIVVIAMSLIFITTLSVGYSILSQTLKIEGEVALRAQKDIRIQKIGEFKSTNEGYDIYNPKYDTNSITTNIALPNIDSTVTYTVEIKNNKNIAMDVTDIEKKAYNNDNIIYEFSGMHIGYILYPNTTTTFTITFKYPEATTILPEEKRLGANIVFTFEQHKEPQTEQPKEYIIDENILNLSGEERNENNLWLDKENKKGAKLEKVIYNETKKAYQFSNESYAIIEEQTIPENNNFTMEIYFSYPNDIEQNQEQTIIYKESKEKNFSDFGIFAKKMDNKKMLVLTYIDPLNQIPKEIIISDQAKENELYSIQIIKENNEWKIYQDAILKRTEQINGNLRISNTPLQIGKGKTEKPSFYHGDIYTIRVYNKALTKEEIITNQNLDNDLYNN